MKRIVIYLLKWIEYAMYLNILSDNKRQLSLLNTDENIITLSNDNQMSIKWKKDYT